MQKSQRDLEFAKMFILCGTVQSIEGYSIAFASLGNAYRIVQRYGNQHEQFAAKRWLEENSERWWDAEKDEKNN